MAQANFCLSFFSTYTSNGELLKASFSKLLSIIKSSFISTFVPEHQAS